MSCLRVFSLFSEYRYLACCYVLVVTSVVTVVTVVVTFIALLELMKGGKIRVQQAGVDGELWVYRVLDDEPSEGVNDDV